MRAAGTLFLLTAGLTAGALPGCVVEEASSDTLASLVPPVTTTTVVRTTTATTSPPDRPRPTAPPAVTQDRADLPVGDWEGFERFDIGKIDRVTAVAGNPAIDFDRHTYQDPEGNQFDVESFDSEPIQFWYTSTPFINISTELRTFVLDPRVEILVLDAASRPANCDGTANAQPQWRPVDRPYLDTPEAMENFASLTYSPDGLVTRIRFTRGC